MSFKFVNFIIKIIPIEGVRYFVTTQLRILFVTLLTALLAGCAGQQSAVRQTNAADHEPDSKAVELYTEGVTREINEEYEAALLLFNEALLYDPASSDIMLSIGKTYLELGKEESGMIMLRQSLMRDDKQIEAASLLAGIYANQGWWDLVERTYYHILSVDSTHEEACYNLAILYLRQSKLDLAVKMYKTLLRHQETTDPQVLIGLGSIYLNQSKFKEAGEIYRRFIQAFPDKGLGYYGLGTTLEIQGDTLQARGYFEQALEREPDMRQARDKLLYLYMKEKAWDKAGLLYHKALEQDSTNIVIWLEQADLYKEEGDSTKAHDAYRDVCVRFPDDWRSHLNYGRFFLDRGEYNSALPSFKKAVELSPDTYWGWVFTGISLSHMDSLEQSAPYLEKAVSIIPDDPMGNFYLGSVYSELGENASAEAPLLKALEARPNWMSALGELANVYDKLNQFALSDSIYQTALSIDPQNALMLNNYGYSLSLRGERIEEALEMAKRALEKDPDNGAYLDTVGWINYLLGNYEAARTYIEKAFELRPDSVEVMEHLGDVYTKLNMIQEAKQIWARALEIDKENETLIQKLGGAGE